MTAPTQAQRDALQRELSQVASDICHPDDCKKWLMRNFRQLSAALTTTAALTPDKRFSSDKD
jgi:hypothetical protein